MAEKLEKKFPTLALKDEKEIAMDFALKVYERFNKLVKSIILFGSAAKGKAEKGSDIDIVIIVDDASIKWDDELVAWYREELGRLIQLNPYIRPLHVNTVRLITWWEELMRGEPVVINVIRYGEPLVDFGGFFTPLKFLLAEGKIKSTPEAIYNALERVPRHFNRSHVSLFNAIEGIYWAMVDASHALLITVGQIPPSPELIPQYLKEFFVDKKLMPREYAEWMKEIHEFAHKILHGDVKKIDGKEVDEWRARADKFVGDVAKLIVEILKV
jgi:predicted nucleotidyltransferase/uncharacterized protein (UPF0332 family)